jgi:hypothetical protein
VCVDKRRNLAFTMGLERLREMVDSFYSAKILLWTSQ